MVPQGEDASGEAYCATEGSGGDGNDAQCDDEPRIEEAKEEELSRSASSQTSANLRWPKASSLMERGKSVSKTLSIASTRLIGIDFDHGSDEFYRFTKCSVMVNGKELDQHRPILWNKETKQHHFATTVDLATRGNHELAVRVWDNSIKTWSAWSAILKVDSSYKSSPVKSTLKMKKRSPIDPRLPPDFYKEKLAEVRMRKQLYGKIIDTSHYMGFTRTGSLHERGHTGTGSKGRTDPMPSIPDAGAAEEIASGDSHSGSCGRSSPMSRAESLPT